VWVKVSGSPTVVVVVVRTVVSSRYETAAASPLPHTGDPGVGSGDCSDQLEARIVIVFLAVLAPCSHLLKQTGRHHRWHTGFGSCGRRDTNAVAKGLIAATGGDLEALRSGLNERLAGLAHFTWMGSFEELCGSNQPEAKKFRGAFREDGDDSPIRPDELDDFAEGLIDDGYYVLPGSGFRPPDRPLHPPRTPSAPGSTSGRFGACCWRCTAE
jgi:hypothetical protein